MATATSTDLNTLVTKQLKVNYTKFVPYGYESRELLGSWIVLAPHISVINELTDENAEILVDLFTADDVSANLMKRLIDRLVSLGTDDVRIELEIVEEEQMRDFLLSSSNGTTILDRALNHTLTKKDVHFYQNLYAPIYLLDCIDKTNPTRKELVTSPDSNYLCALKSENPNIKLYVLELN